MADTGRKITLWGIEVFIAAAEEGSVTAAAERLGASAATVSQQLTKLEVATGVRLMDRAARPFTLTPAGEMFLRRANAILNEAEQARAELGQARMTGLTRLRLGMIEDFDADVTPRFLREMAGELSRAQFLLETGASHRLLDGLEARALDVVVAADLGQAMEGVEVHALLREPFILAVPRGMDPAEVRDHPLIRYTSRHAMGRQISDHLARCRIRAEHRFELDSYHAILAMVAEGAGWTILTPLGWLRAARFREDVDVHPLPFPPFHREIRLSAREGVLGGWPAEMADRLRGLLAELTIRPAVSALPWLDGEMQVLRDRVT